MTSPYTVYDLTTGRILRSGVCSDPSAEPAAGEGHLDYVADDATQYVLGGAAVPKQPLPHTLDTSSVPADGTTLATISGLPNPTDVSISGPAASSFTTTDGSAAMTFTLPGAYTVRLVSFPYLDAEVTINAT